MKRIVIVGSGFAGTWSALSAARQLNQFNISSDEVKIQVVNRDAYLGIRPRFYEKNPQNYRFPLEKVFKPTGVDFIQGEVEKINTESQVVTINRQEKLTIHYDRLIYTAGSQLIRPNIQGFQHSFSVDTLQDAVKLDQHIHQLPSLSTDEGKYTVVVVGAGFAGLEVATEMVSRIQEIAKKEKKESEAKVILIERASVVGPELGANPRPIIEQALQELNIEVHTNETVSEMTEQGIVLQNGKRIPAATVIWTAGLQANPLAKWFPVEKDHLGRLSVDSYLKVEGINSVFAAGDAVKARTDDHHFSLMSCQHANPQGRVAGHNAVCDLLGIDEKIPYRQEGYKTGLDLGAWGALITSGWDRVPVMQKEEAKKVKRGVNQAIYPPSSENRDEIFAAAELL
ncbi:FAD-dependent oxidoreductase [Shimazuella sp. AN120528]|uniref:NAD(P)/FAD-dependent oxidoreductase n=1 Tax=Shimazuella soli TaxID=1892854 RepID=UPI001F0CE1FF|nr:FAD-dependent oxidoreductase [Shimazuella soli]MCH5584534.1 FAD-dependent oxidoreductase [Shimazuella soli]